MRDTKESGGVFGRGVLGVCALLLCLLFAFLAVYGLFYTSVIDPEAYREEHILYVRESALLNCAALALFFLLLYLLRKLLPTVDALPLWPLTLGTLALIGAAGGLWVFSVQSVPATDSGEVTAAAAQALSGDFSFLQTEYFIRYPYQLGYVLYSTLLQAVLGSGSYGALGFVNVLFLLGAYGALLHMTWGLWKSKKIQLCLLLLLLLFSQPVFFCTFLYGNIPGLCCALWAMALAMAFYRQRKLWQGLFVGLLCALAVVLKPNYWIAAAAVALFLLVTCKRKRLLPTLLTAALAILLPLGAMKAVEAGYEKAGDTLIGPGTPQIAWLAMGLQEGQRAPGWYNKYAKNILAAADYDQAAAKRQIRQDILERLQVFREKPAYAADFFFKKLVSEWNETTYESLWVSAVKEHARQVPGWVNALYESGVLTKYMKLTVLGLYASFALGALLIGLGAFKKKESGPKPLLLLLFVGGGFCYHMLFEAKSQYLLVYLFALLPLGALGLERITAPRKNKAPRIQ